MKNKEIIAGYVYPGEWKGKGSSIWPEWWINPDKTSTWYDGEYQKEQEEDMKQSPPEEVILESNTEYTLKIDYPLSNPFVAKFKTEKDGMTRQEFVDLACESYQHIYEVEDAGKDPGTIPGMYNRVITDGEFGIWGHYIGDLTIHTLYIDENNLITLGVDS